MSVSKIRGINANDRNADRLYKLDRSKYSLSKDSGVDKKVYKNRADNKKFLKLEDREVFDNNMSFKLSSHDTYRFLGHTGVSMSNKKGRRK